MHSAGFAIQQSLLFCWSLNRLNRKESVYQTESFAFDMSRQIHNCVMGPMV